MKIYHYVLCFIGITTAMTILGGCCRKDAAEVDGDMCRIPAGMFKMGDNFEEGNKNERPVHDVSLGAFSMDKHEVTKKLWNSIYLWAIDHGYEFDSLVVVGSEGEFPVNNINWYDAVKWCNARSEKQGLIPVYCTDASKTNVYRMGQKDVRNDWVKWEADGYRLPTEAEWEKAARGGDEGKRYPWGDEKTDGTKANYLRSGDKYEGTLNTIVRAWHICLGATPVGYYNSKQVVTNSSGDRMKGTDMANGYGLYDMSGNILEWCWDWYDDGYYSNSPGNDPRGPESGKRYYIGRGYHGFVRATRGSSFNSPCKPSVPDALRCSRRGATICPAFFLPFIGFRCVKRN